MLMTYTTIYITLGFIAAYAHWAKKRYYDNTTTSTYPEYLLGERGATQIAFVNVVCSELLLASAHGAVPFTINDIIAALGTGYSMDSVFNRAPK